MRAIVYHLTPIPGAEEAAVAQAMWDARDVAKARAIWQTPGDQPTVVRYVPVAEVSGVADIEQVFHGTNHIDRNWTENRGVLFLGANRDKVRSTSVGDIVVFEGKVMHCAPCGWNEV